MNFEFSQTPQDKQPTDFDLFKMIEAYRKLQQEATKMIQKSKDLVELVLEVYRSNSDIRNQIISNRDASFTSKIRAKIEILENNKVKFQSAVRMLDFLSQKVGELHVLASQSYIPGFETYPEDEMSDLLLELDLPEETDFSELLSLDENVKEEEDANLGEEGMGILNNIFRSFETELKSKSADPKVYDRNAKQFLTMLTYHQKLKKIYNYLFILYQSVK